MHDFIETIERNQGIATGIIILLVILALTGSIAMDYYDTKNLEVNYQNQVAQVDNAEWIFVESVIMENYDKSKLFGGEMANNITRNVLLSYSGNNEKLVYDISNPSTDSVFSKIIATEVTGKYLNGIQNDNNDPFVATKTGVIGDFSLNCSYEASHRNWELEIPMHWNQPLAAKAIKNIVNQTGSYIFWEFLEPKDPNHLVINDMELSEVRKVFLAEGYKGIKSYEFLQPVYITENGDILGNKDVSNIGTRQSTYKVIIVQGFNVADIIETKYSKRIVQFETMKEDLKKEYSRNLQDKQMKIVIVTILMLISFISIARIQHLQNCK